VVTNGNEGVKIDDQVTALISDASTYRHDVAAFAECTVAKAKLFFRAKAALVEATETSIPQGTIKTYPGAASVGVSVSTVMAVFEYYNKTPIEKNYVSKDRQYLVWGRASALCQIAIQIGNYVSFTVVTAASARNHALMKDLGADAVFDYHDEDIVDKIRALSGDKMVVAYDTISEGAH
jgi:NADPH:quinone reductase-like Zn-dependent oxidoreductase